MFLQIPSDGEFPVMNYRITQEFKPPFRINALIEEAGPLKVSKYFLLVIEVAPPGNFHLKNGLSYSCRLK